MLYQNLKLYLKYYNHQLELNAILLKLMENFNSHFHLVNSFMFYDFYVIAICYFSRNVIYLAFIQTIRKFGIFKQTAEHRQRTHRIY